MQTIYISKASDIGNPHYNPVSGCDVKIIDGEDHIFQLDENEEGVYQGFINQEYLYIGSAFKTEIVTPEGELIISDFDTLQDCPEIDSVYYEIVKTNSSEPEFVITDEQVQFYVDYDGTGTDSRYVKWEIEETWEYHAKYPMRWYYDGVLHEIDPPDYSKNVCWTTNYIRGLYLATTDNLSENKYKKFPIQAINNTSQRLAYGYHMVVKQFAISKEAYEYYNNLKKNVLSDRGLYYSQPVPNRGNLTNMTNPDQTVLGFFYTGGVQTKTMFIYPLDDFELDVVYYCSAVPLGKAGFRKIPWRDYPAWIWVPGLLWISEDCVDCTCSGGTQDKPDFWPY